MRIGLLAGIGLRIVFLWFLYVAVILVADSWRQLQYTVGGVVADGVVVRQIEEVVTVEAVPAQAPKDGPGKPAQPAKPGFEVVSAHRYFRAMVEFIDRDRSYRIGSEARGETPVYPTGSHVDVAYPRNRPADAKLRAELPNVWAQAGFLLMGTVLGAAALYWWWKLLRRRGRINPLSGSRKNVLGG